MGKGKGKGRKAKRKGGFQSWGIWALIVILIGVLLALFSGFSLEGFSGSGRTALPARGIATEINPLLNSTSNSTSTSTAKQLPTYDALYLLSVDNNWTPHDPYEKLELAIQRFATIADTSPAIVTKTAKREALSDTRELAKALITEIIFVLAVMQHDTSRRFDLTPLLFAAVQSIHLSIYSTMKARLREAKEERRVSGSGETIERNLYITTKTATEQVSAGGFLYNPLQELLKLSPVRGESVAHGSSRYPDGNKEFSTRPHDHIIVDLDKKGGALNLTILATAVVYRLYRLLPVLVGIGASTEGALHAAIVAGDDIAVALLLGAAGDDLRSSIDAAPSSREIPNDDSIFAMSPLALATSLGHAAIVNRLKAAKERWELGGQEGLTNYAHVGIKEEAGNNSYAPQVRGGVEGGGGEGNWREKLGKGGGLVGGFRDTGVAVTGFLGSSFQKTPVCLVDRLHAANLSAAALKSLYADRSRPVVISGDAYISRVLQDTWTADKLALRAAAQHVKLGFSTIPYGSSVFGLKDVSVGIAAFLDPAKFGDMAAAERAGKPGVTRKLSSSSTSTSQSLRTSTQIVEQFLLSGAAQSDKSAQKANGLFGWLQPAGSKPGSSTPPPPPPPFVLDISNPDVVQKVMLELDAAPPLYYFGAGQQLVLEERKQLISRPSPDDGNGAHSSLAPEAAYLRSLIAALSLPFSGVEATSPSTARAHPPTFQFYLGSVLSGSPFHSHQWALNGLVHGRKAWLLLPPGRDVYSTVHPLLFSSTGGVLRSDWPYPTASANGTETETQQGPCLLEQRAGEILFVPRHWSHSVLNLAEVVGFAVEGA